MQGFSMTACREAANEAYTTTLAPIHTYLVRAAVRTSMFLLPDRTAFLKSIGETGACCTLNPERQTLLPDRTPSWKA